MYHQPTAIMEARNARMSKDIAEGLVSARTIWDRLGTFPHVKISHDGDLLIPIALSRKLSQLLDEEEKGLTTEIIDIPTLPTQHLPHPPLPFDSFSHQSSLHKVTRVTRKLFTDYTVNWPLGAVVEYPRTTDSPEERIVHIFHAMH
ncbi:uncharacterized protein EI90DRAFT_601626 [Cantharellus anzutake]|uniref:uncharacterized protein n=1 Tax=Cantharellus anzutake TaxID=1750568 RepID=UPI0019060C04|nr:uncharacterized protein EI90DRAFT_601626 [Cantharellus anzutake]KAF8313153.1 hypothetical protein EI90DRAFT_601626 [Cantharellus anzutake]